MRLQDQIKKKGLTNKELAKRIDIDSTMLSRITNYRCLPIPNTMEAICKELDCEIKDIYEDNEVYYKRKLKGSKNLNNYKLTVNLPKEAQENIKKMLKTCGYRDITEWIFKCYKRLEKQFGIIQAYKREKASQETEKPKS